METRRSKAGHETSVEPFELGLDGNLETNRLFFELWYYSQSFKRPSSRSGSALSTQRLICASLYRVLKWPQMTISF